MHSFLRVFYFFKGLRFNEIYCILKILGSYIWHVRGLTKWRLFDYEGWPKRISTLFPSLPANIDSAYLYDDHYHFTKVIMILKTII